MNILRKFLLMSNLTKKRRMDESRISAKDQIQKRKVIEHNDLISSVAKMDKTSLKIFELAVSCINTENPPKDFIVYLSKKELFTFFDVVDNDKHSRFKQAIEKMQEQAFFEVREEKNKGFKFRRIVPIPMIEWNDYNDEVKIAFSEYIMPYLIELKSNFTQYAISDIMELNSKYSIILYKWLCMFYNQYEHYSINGKRRQKQLDSYCQPIITVKELRILTDTVTSYKQFTRFNNDILKKPIEEINAYTHFTVHYEKIKKGREIHSIQFFISKKKTIKSEYYKQEQEDEVYLKAGKKKEEQNQKLFAMAITSKYTTLLLENALLSPFEMQDIELMAKLQQIVYPYYKELENIRGVKGVVQHLSYVSMKREDYSKKNISLYLKKAITGYLNSIK